MPGSGSIIWAPGGRSRGHDGRQSYEVLVRVGDLHGLRWPAGCDAPRVPPTAVTPNPSGRWLFRPGVTRPLAFFVGRGDGANDALDVGEPGFIRRPRVPDHAGSNPAIQTDRRKGKPTGDGTRPEPGRATRLEGSTPSPSAERCARGRAAQASVFQTGQAGSTPAGHSDRWFFDKVADDWTGRQPADHPLREGGMLGVQLPPGPLNATLADQPGVVVTLSR